MTGTAPGEQKGECLCFYHFLLSVEVSAGEWIGTRFGDQSDSVFHLGRRLKSAGELNSCMVALYDEDDTLMGKSSSHTQVKSDECEILSIRHGRLVS